VPYGGRQDARLEPKYIQVICKHSVSPPPGKCSSGASVEFLRCIQWSSGLLEWSPHPPSAPRRCRQCLVLGRFLANRIAHDQPLTTLPQHLARATSAQPATATGYLYMPLCFHLPFSSNTLYHRVGQVRANAGHGLEILTSANCHADLCRCCMSLNSNFTSLLPCADHCSNTCKRPNKDHPLPGCCSKSSSYTFLASTSWPCCASAHPRQGLTGAVTRGGSM
jgi:hypothetical protein